MLTTLLDRIGLHADRTLVSDHAGEYTGRQLLDTAAAIAASVPAPGDGGPERVALLATPGLGYVAGMLGIWMRGAMAVPLCPEHPPAEIAYVLEDADVTAVLVDDALRPLLPPTAVATVSLPAGPGAPGLSPWPSPPADALALMLYTSGTTGRPKGVVHTHATVTAQITCLIEAWAWGPDDRTLHFLPLHHTHGIVNQLLCPLWAGARCDMIPRFDAVTAFELLASTPYTVFMAVPTIYAKAIAAWEGAAVETRAAWSEGCRRLRLMISGSAALAVPILHRWHTISGHVLLERYGLTEIGMALTNPLHGERRPGFVGTPVPGMEVRLVDDDGVVVGSDGTMGELQVRGANVFVEYWRRPAETAASFTADGWFRTGDVVALDGGAYRIAGRLSTDIIKSGGYKSSALEIESVLAGHPAIAECTVVGTPDDTWGDCVSVAAVVRPGATLELHELQEWARPHLAAYKLPRRLVLVESLPRNVMGKVLKPAAKTLF